MTLKENLQKAAAVLTEQLEGRTPEIGIILGSGLGPLAESVEDAVYVPFGDVPYMKRSTATSHVGRFVCGNLGGKCVIVMQGRLHAYEGSSGAALAKDIEAAGSIEGLRGICLFRYGACVLGRVANGKLILANPLSESITRIELTEGEQKQSLEIALPPQERLTLSHASDVCMLRAWAGEKEVCAYLAK